MGSPEVLLVTMLPGFRALSMRASSSRFGPSCSTMASTIQSASPTRPKSSSRLPTVTSAAGVGREEGGGLRLLQTFERGVNDAVADGGAVELEPALLLFRRQLVRRDVEEVDAASPALAACAAMPPPIVPEPMTTTLLMV